MATISHITLPDNTDYSIQATGIFFGQVDSTSTSTVYTATIPGVTEYYDGLTILLKNGIVTSASGFTININDLGAKPSYSNMTTGNDITPTAPTRDTTIFNINYTMLFVYDSTLVEGGAWICYRGYDANTNTIGYQLRTNSTVLKTADASRYYRLFFTSADGTHWVPANTAKDNSATSTKTVNQRAIDPHGRIIYYAATTNLSAESDVPATNCWDQYTLPLGYSFNRTGAALTLTAKAPIYIKCAPQANGSAIIDSTTPYVQALPSTADGKIYIFLGIAYSATNFELVPNHPVYEYKDGAIRLWTNAPAVSVPTASDANPQMDGTAAAGTSNNYSRADHVHPSDTSRMAANLKGVANGVAELDNNGKVPSSQLPSYVDDVIEGYYYNSKFYKESSHTTEIAGETGKIYVDLSTEKTYRWSGTAFVEISASLALGETSSTAYRGDRGKTAYDHSQLTSGNPHNVSKSDIGLGNVDNVQQYSVSNPPPYPVTSVNGSTGAVSLSIPTKTSDLTNDSGFITGMTILSYGNSTWNDFITAYDANKVVYCRASSNANPASGAQTRLAFMAYVNNAITEVEFQYYRSVSTHTESQQGDQVYVYKLNKNNGWSVTVHEASVKVAYNNGITGTYSNGVMTLKHANTAITAQSTQAVYPIAIDTYGHITGYGSAVTIPEIPSVTASDNGKILTVVNGAWDADDANFIPGIESKTYETLFGGEFTVTTATDAEHEHPYANTGIIWFLDKRYAYRITFDGEQYVLPPQIFATEYIDENNDTWTTYAYVGDISLYHKPMDGLLNEQQNVPFLITEHYSSGKDWLDVYTSVAGEHTFLIEGVDASYDRIPSDLIYGNVFPPFQYLTDNNGRQGFSVGSNRLITANHKPPMYAFGYDNVVSGQGACAIGVLNEASGRAAMAFGYGNKASGAYSRAFGRRNIASGNQSFADGQKTIASGAISRSEGDGCRAAAVGSHAEGGGTYADESQIYIHVGGVNNAVSTATGKTVTITRYNEDGTVDSTSTRTLGKYAEVIGNGDSDQARSNARTLDWNGNEAIAGNLTLGLGTQGEITLTPAQLATVLASLLPAVSASDNGKVLTVVNGAWAAAELPTYQGGVS